MSTKPGRIARSLAAIVQTAEVPPFAGALDLACRAPGVAEDTHTGERITCQQFADGRALIKVHRGGRIAEYVTYRQAERIHRKVTAEHLELP